MRSTKTTVGTVSFLCASLFGAAPALAQVHVEVMAPPPPHVVVSAPPPPRVVVAPPPAIRFEAPPPLVTVQPGVQVVRDYDEEVYFSGGYYWRATPEGVWYRTRSYRGGWAVAPRHVVPVAVMRLPRGQYRHFRGEGWHEQRHEDRAIRHEEKAMRHEQRREEHREGKAERHWEGHHGRRG
jgi:hypothetical protein